MDTNIIGIIPARMASSRFPNKPLAKIRGIPMLGHVYYRSKMCPLLKEVYIATCDKEIADYAGSIGAKPVMTKDTHQRASERVSEAMIKIEQETRSRSDIVVMIQGDEPMIHPDMIGEAVRPLIEDPGIPVVNLMGPLKTREEHEDPHEIKVVVDLNNFALYFSREPIPSWKRGAKEINMLKQICVIPFRREFLIKFNELTTTPLEIIESIDMLRVLEHGYKVKMVLTNFNTYSVDTPADLKKVENLMLNDPFIRKYK
ncbi:MAG: 3-deoxy-manno-octulosonate cytidylyltransferase [Candidatus Omnitrophica bacterium]|nr:3-deoxy-manno-octulosonate cytidylyltransferase [Candidatus Omnitrophota bacterium]